MKTSFTHSLQSRIMLESGSDSRAPGGAVTVALCGHWDHEGPCRWPHHTSVSEAPDGTHTVTVRYDAPDEEREYVRGLILDALATGTQAGPDGRVSRWTRVLTRP